MASLSHPHEISSLLLPAPMSTCLLEPIFKYRFFSQVALVVKEPVCQYRRQEMYETWVQSLGWEDPLEEGMATHSCILAGESHGQRNLVGYSP